MINGKILRFSEQYGHYVKIVGNKEGLKELALILDMAIEGGNCSSDVVHDDSGTKYEVIIETES